MSVSTRSMSVSASVSTRSTPFPAHSTSSNTIVTRSRTTSASSPTQPMRLTADDCEAATILLSLRSASSRESCPSAVCAVCTCSGRRVTRSQMSKTPEDAYEDMPALISIPIETPRFRLLETTDDYSEFQLEGRRTGLFTNRTRVPKTTRPLRLASLRGLSERAFGAFLESLDDAALEALRRTSDQALASDANLGAAQRTLLLDKIRERSSEETRVFAARRRRLC